jgi:hypothetical protein
MQNKIFHCNRDIQMFLSELLGFWTSSIIQYSKNYRIQCFGNWICFRPQVTG